jgi:hypothetical protein
MEETELSPDTVRRELSDLQRRLNTSLDRITPLFSIPTAMRIAYEFQKLQEKFGFFVYKASGLKSKKCINFFNKAFTRWMFNMTRLGVNPFTSLLASDVFVCQSDVVYYVERNPEDVALQRLDWAWLDVKFRNIFILKRKEHRGSLVKKTMENFCRFEYTWDDNHLVTYMLPTAQYEKLKNVYTGPASELDLRVTLMLARYYACGSINNHCSVPKEVISFCGITTELFGSPLNTCTPQYCSPFADVESAFGSLGSFYTFIMGTGIYLMNPPYDEDIMEVACKKVISVLEDDDEVTIVAVLPVWDIETQRDSGPVFCNKDFVALKILEASPFVKSRAHCVYDTHKFYDYYKDQLVAVTNIHLLVLSNTNCGLIAQQIADYWAQVSAR